MHYFCVGEQASTMPWTRERDEPGITQKYRYWVGAGDQDHVGWVQEQQQAEIRPGHSRHPACTVFTVATQPTKQQKIDPKEKVKEGFARGLQAEKIIGIRKDPEKLFFLVKWKGTEDKDFVDAKEAKIKIPQVVIEFYEEKLNWFNDPEDSQDEDEE